MNHALNARWGVHLAARVRLDDDVSEAKDSLIRPFVTWRPRERLDLDLGYDYLHSFQGSTEHRIWQSAEYSLGWGGSSSRIVSASTSASSWTSMES